MIETLIDFSADLGAVRDQDARGMCLAFASSDLNQRTNGFHDHLSVEYLAHYAAAAMPGWTPAHGLSFLAVAQALALPGQPLEIVYPYVPSNENQPLTVPPQITASLYTCSVLQNGTNAPTVISALQARRPVCLGLAINDEWFSPRKGVIQYSTAYTGDKHAVLAVGLGIDHSAGEHFVLVRNSWGPTWGIHEDGNPNPKKLSKLGRGWIGDACLRCKLIEHGSLLGIRMEYDPAIVYLLAAADCWVSTSLP